MLLIFTRPNQNITDLGLPGISTPYINFGNFRFCPAFGRNSRSCITGSTLATFVSCPAEGGTAKVVLPGLIQFCYLLFCFQNAFLRACLRSFLKQALISRPISFIKDIGRMTKGQTKNRLF